MEVYLVRHGEAVSEHQNPERPLSDKGRSDVSIVADHIGKLGLEITTIYHSERLRARQTAEILSEKVRPRNGLREVRGLASGDDVRKAMQLVEDAKESIMIVGHLPHLGKLLSALVAGEQYQNMEMMEFDAGSIVCLGRGQEGWLVRWALSRRTVRP